MSGLFPIYRAVLFVLLGGLLDLMKAHWSNLHRRFVKGTDELFLFGNTKQERKNTT